MITTRLYARVSSEEQQEKYGLDSQLRELRQHAGKLEHAIAGEYTDTISGANDSRPHLNRLIADVRAGDIVLVHHPDRLSRAGVAHQFLIEEDLQRTGAVVEYVLLPRGGQGDAEWTLQKTQMASFAQYERAKIRERTTRGRNEKAWSGRIVAGTAPYGYRIEHDRYVIEPDEASTVRLMYSLATERHLSTRGIALELQRLGIPTARGGMWRRNGVRATLRNTTYKGQAFFNRTKHEKVGGKLKQVARAQALHITIACPSIVSDETWQGAQDVLERNRTAQRGCPPKRFYLLRGMFVCSVCGRKLTGDTARGKRYYRCGGRREDNCKAKAIHADVIEATVWEEVRALIWGVEYPGGVRQPTLIGEQIIDEWQAGAGVADIEIKSAVEHLAKQLTSVDRQEKRAMELYLDGGGDLEIVKDKLLALQDQKRAIQGRLSDAQVRVQAQDSAGARQVMLARYIETLKAMVAPDQDDEAKRVLLATLVEKIEIGITGPVVYFSFLVPALGNCPPPHPDDSPGLAACAPPPGPRLPLPGLRAPVRPRASRPPLGARGPDDPVEPRSALSPAPPRGARRRLSGRSTARRRASVPTAGWSAPTRGHGPGRGAHRSGPGPAGAARRAGAPPPRADGLPVLAGGALGCGLRDRRVASLATRLPESARREGSRPSTG